MNAPITTDPAALLADLRRRGVRIEPDGDALDIEGPESVITDALLADVRAHKPALLRLLDPPGLSAVLAAACAPLGLDPAVLRAELGAQDLGDFAAGELTPDALAAWAWAITIRRMRERGEVPAHYTAVTHCQGCGPVPIFPGTPDVVEACPWCFNRVAGRALPKVTP